MVVECILLVYCITLYSIALIYGLEWAGGGGVYPAGPGARQARIRRRHLQAGYTKYV